MLVELKLIEKARSGDHSAFGHVVIAYRGRILSTAGRLVGRPEDAEDVAQEVCLKLFYSLNRLKTAELFEPWLYRLTVNASYDYLRKRRRRNEARMSDLNEQQVILADAASGTVTSGEGQRLEEVKDLVDSLMNSIPKHDRILLTLKEVKDLSVKQLAGIYSVDETTMKVRLFRARQRALKIYKATHLKNAIVSTPKRERKPIEGGHYA